MTHVLLIAAGGAAIVAGLAGCSSGDTSSTESSSSESSAAASADSGGSTTVSVDGQDQDITGTVVCTNIGDTIAIAIGEGTTGIAATVTTGDAPTVKQVALGNVNGAVLGFQEGVPGGEAAVEKDGNTYTITGQASGADMSNPMAGIVTKPFEIEVACP